MESQWKLRVVGSQRIFVTDISSTYDYDLISIERKLCDLTTIINLIKMHPLRITPLFLLLYDDYIILEFFIHGR